MANFLNVRGVGSAGGGKVGREDFPEDMGLRWMDVHLSDRTATGRSLMTGNDHTEEADTAPTRLDRAPWSGLHSRILLALGIGWALDSFEVQIIGSVLTPLAKDFGVLGADGAIAPWYQAAPAAIVRRPASGSRDRPRRSTPTGPASVIDTCPTLPAAVGHVWHVCTFET